MGHLLDRVATAPSVSFLPERLRAAREARGLSIQEAARSMKASADAWADWEDGKQVPDFRTGCMAAVVCHVAAEWLCGLGDITTLRSELGRQRILEANFL